ncbi:MAG TPA: hypothetical protein VNE83_03520 [Terriglobales bacterium]|nr:hypothetical protein [Terriglobales bacterium]
MNDERHPDLVESALDAVLAAYAAVEPSPEAAARWRRALRRPPRADRFLGLTARAWAFACCLCLVLSGAFIFVRGGFAPVMPGRVAPLALVEPGPRAAPVLLPAPTPVRPRPTHRSPTRLLPERAVVAEVLVPSESRAVRPTGQERLLARLVEQNPTALATLFSASALPAVPPPPPAAPANSPSKVTTNDN